MITRVVDYGGLFFDDVLPGQEIAPRDHRGFRPAGWIEAGRERMEAMRPIAERAGLTHDPARLPVEPAPTSRRVRRADADPGGRAPTPAPVEDKRAELAALPAEIAALADDVERSARSATTPAAWR